VPTMKQRGFRDFDVRDWQGIVAPRGTPAAMVGKISDAIERIGALPEVKERFTSVGMDAVEHGGPDDFGALIRSELDRWKKVVRESGIHAD
jgi:tripartite-type tricarboxylate transporter receptor subunit TctC